MARNRFVNPETVRVDLSDGDWLDLKSALSYGEQQALSNSMFDHYKGDEVTLAWDRHNVLRIKFWVEDWSFVDAKGKQVPLSEDSIRALDPDAADEVQRAITAHQAVMEAGKVVRSGNTNGVGSATASPSAAG